MLTGQKGIKYGLQKNPRAPQQKVGAAKPLAQLAAFAQGDSSDEEDNVSVQLKRQQAHKAKQAKVSSSRSLSVPFTSRIISVG